MAHQYTIRHFHYLPALKFGCLVGAIGLSLPALLAGVAAGRRIGGLREWLEANALLDLPGILPDLDLLTILGLRDTFTRLQGWDDLGMLLVLGIALTLVLGGAVWFAIAALLSAMVYNVVATVTGGLTFSADTAGQVAAVSAPEASLKAPYLVNRPDDQQRAFWGVMEAIVPAAGLARQQQWLLSGDQVTLGSSGDNTIVISGLAGHHAEIYRREEGFALYDRSGGQSWLNGRAVGNGAWLREGDTVRLGSLEFTFHTR